jgi:hypothetical protein
VTEPVLLMKIPATVLRTVDYVATESVIMTSLRIVITVLSIANSFLKHSPSEMTMSPGFLHLPHPQLMMMEMEILG